MAQVLCYSNHKLQWRTLKIPRQLVPLCHIGLQKVTSDLLCDIIQSFVSVVLGDRGEISILAGLYVSLI